MTQPVQELIAREARGFEPYPWGRVDWAHAPALITFAQPLALEYAELLRGLDESELMALADSFANCAVREPLRRQLAER